MIFKELREGGGGGRTIFNHNVSDKTLKIYYIVFLGGGAVNYLWILASHVRSWNLITA